ncbi:MAG: DUF4912 domain-containing protein [Bacillota bacterium]
MTALSVLLGIIILAVVLAAVAWPAIKSRSQKKPEPEFVNAKPAFREEYSEELSPPVRTPALEPVPELPGTYGIDRLVLMVRDPYWLYAYWEVTATKMEEISSKFDPAVWKSSKAALRVYDVTGIDFNGSNAHSYFDYSLNENVDDWHIKVHGANRSYCVDMGRLFPDGSFITILRSNIVTTPRDMLSDRLDEEWMWIEGLYFRHQPGVSSPLIIEEMKERMGNIPLGISSPGFSPGFYKREHSGDDSKYV